MHVTAEQARAIGVEAYTYLYPLVTMEVTREQLSQGAPDARPGRGPMGMFHHMRAFPTADFKVVVRPNFDTLYSSAWLDVGPEPVIVSIPPSEGRYHLLPCLDMWTDVFACPGTRTNGDGPFSFALCTPDWRGELPEGVERIDAPTPTVWIVGRIQTNGPADYPAVHAFQDALALTPLSSWGTTPPTPPTVEDPSVDAETPPLDQVNAMSAAELLDAGARLMGQHPPHATDWSTIARLRRIGVVPGQPFDVASQPAEVVEGLSEVAAAAQATMAAMFPRLAPVVDGWMSPTDTMGVYGDFYLKRAIVAMVGLGANPAEDAVYPVLEVDADGEPLTGERSYVIRFEADRLPPVDAFWSITMYDAEGFQAANELDRFAIGDRDPLVFGDDGSLEITVSHERPADGLVANWLPAPLGPLGVTMRMYSPKPEVLTGAWTPPPVRRLA